jgi:hypothetical protein
MLYLYRRAYFYSPTPIPKPKRVVKALIRCIGSIVGDGKGRYI